MKMMPWLFSTALAAVSVSALANAAVDSAAPDISPVPEAQVFGDAPKTEASAADATSTVLTSPTPATVPTEEQTEHAAGQPVTDPNAEETGAEDTATPDAQ